MARVSFRLRNSGGDKGAYVQYDDSLGVRNDYDSALRADGVQLPPVEVVTSSFFEATSSCYGEVDLSWSLPLTAPGDIGVAAAPATAVVVYSPFGPPSTVSSGSVIAESNVLYNARQTNLADGKWAYYSLFVRYRNNDYSDDYYEKVAELSELVPANHGSITELWLRIPEFYRTEDTRIGDYNVDTHCLGFDNYGEPVGPLLKFLSVVGFEMDRTRTVLDYIATSNDPTIADSEALDALSDGLGVAIGVDDLGTHRLRSILEDIGWFRRIKGTESGTEFFVKSLSGSDAVLDLGARTIDVYAFRVNHMLDPQNTKSITDRITSRLADVAEASNPSTYEFGDVVPTPTADTTVYHIDSPVTVAVGDILSFSVHSGVGGASIQWARAVDSTTGVIYDVEPTVVTRFGTPYFDIDISTAATVNIEYMVDTTTLTYEDTHFLLEKNGVGEYFDGNTKRGGWLIGVSNISDYRWAAGGASAHDSISLYNEDYERTKQIVEQLFKDVLPIDQASYANPDDWTVTYNNIP